MQKLKLITWCIVGALSALLVGLLIKQNFTQLPFGGPIEDMEEEIITPQDTDTAMEEFLNINIENETFVSKKITPKEGMRYVYNYNKKDLTIGVNFDGFNQCIAGQFASSSLQYCKAFLKKQIQDNLQWAKEAENAQAIQKALPDKSYLIDEKSF